MPDLVWKQPRPPTAASNISWLKSRQLKNILQFKLVNDINLSGANLFQKRQTLHVLWEVDRCFGRASIGIGNMTNTKENKRHIINTYNGVSALRWIQWPVTRDLLPVDSSGFSWGEVVLFDEEHSVSKKKKDTGAQAHSAAQPSHWCHHDRRRNGADSCCRWLSLLHILFSDPFA